MNFILGLAVGGMLATGPNAPASSLSAIPLRCLYAFEQSETEYRECRMSSLYRELENGTPCHSTSIRSDSGSCSAKRHLDWEAGALRSLKAELAKKPAP